MGSRPIANKYHEGKLKRTLKRKVKVLEIAEKEVSEANVFLARLLRAVANACCASALCASELCAGSAQCFLPCLSMLLRARGRFQGHGSSPQGVNILVPTRVRGIRRANGCTRPVLKHGPRSLTCMQV